MLSASVTFHNFPGKSMSPTLPRDNLGLRCPTFLSTRHPLSIPLDPVLLSVLICPIAPVSKLPHRPKFEQLTAQTQHRPRTLRNRMSVYSAVVWLCAFDSLGSTGRKCAVNCDSLLLLTFCPRRCDTSCYHSRSIAAYIAAMLLCKSYARGANETLKKRGSPVC